MKRIHPLPNCTRLRHAYLCSIGLGLLLLLVVSGGCTGDWKSAATTAGKRAKASAMPAEPLDLFTPRPIGNPFDALPKISFVKIFDLDQDGLNDVLVCDCTLDAVCWIRQTATGEFQEEVIADGLIAPARLECADVDGDGDQDLVVAVLGQLFPTNEPVGSLIVLENIGGGEFRRRTLLAEVARVADVRAADLDTDGDLDLVVTQFGYYDGQLQWLENLGDWEFTSHPLQSLAGGIHGIVADMNQDGQPDITALISQEVEAIYLFAGTGQGRFVEQKIYAAGDPDFGSAGISLSDLDGDGDLDILYCNGDAFDYSPPRPWPWHGFQWLENRGQLKFGYHRVLDLGGAVNAQAVDFDDDGDQDIFVISTFNDWDTPASQSLVYLQNDGAMNFTAHALANAPTHLQALDIGDLDGDGKLDLVTGGMHVSTPYDRVERVVWWQGHSISSD